MRYYRRVPSTNFRALPEKILPVRGSRYPKGKTEDTRKAVPPATH